MYFSGNLNNCPGLVLSYFPDFHSPRLEVRGAYASFVIKEHLRFLVSELKCQGQQNSILMCFIHSNGYIITWILYQIFIYSNKVKLKACSNKDPPSISFNQSPSSTPPPGWANWPINEFYVSKLSLRQFSWYPCIFYNHSKQAKFFF